MLLAAALGTLALGLAPKVPPGPGEDLGPIVERLAGPDPVARRLAQRDLSRALTGVGEAAVLDAPRDYQRLQRKWAQARPARRGSRQRGVSHSGDAGDGGA